MFKYLESIRNIKFKNYHLMGSQLLTVFLDGTGNTIISVYDAATFTAKKEINLESKTFNIFFYLNNELLAYFPLQRLIRVDLQVGKIQPVEGVKFAPELLIGNSLLGISVDETSNKVLARMDLATNELRTLIKEPFRLWGSNLKDVYGVKIGKGQEIYSIDPQNGAINWSHDFGTDLSGKVFSYENVVLVIGRSKIFGINADNGNILWQNESANALSNLYGDTLVNVTTSNYREVSSETGKTLVEYSMKTEYKKHGFKFVGTNSNFTITDTHVFIVDAMGYMLGCINRDTGKIDWSVEVGERKVTLPHAPIVYENRLYVLDDEGTLHVFEKE